MTNSWEWEGLLGQFTGEYLRKICQSARTKCALFTLFDRGSPNLIMKKKPIIPKQVKWFVAAMLGIIVLMALAALVVDLSFAQ